MDWKYLLNLRGVNYWLLASGFGLNLLWTLGIFMFAVPALAGGNIEVIQLGVMVTIFVGTFVVAWLVGKMAHDNRGPTYGLYTSLGSVAPVLFIILPSGILGVLAAVMALAGGLNGGLMTLPRRK